MSGGGRAPPTASTSVTTTITLENPDASTSSQSEALVLRLNRKKKQVTWKEGTVDNEFMQKKSSKKCCIFHKDKPFDEDDSDDDHDHHHHDHDHPSSSHPSSSVWSIDRIMLSSFICPVKTAWFDNLVMVGICDAQFLLMFFFFFFFFSFFFWREGGFGNRESGCCWCLVSIENVFHPIAEYIHLVRFLRWNWSVRVHNNWYTAALVNGNGGHSKLVWLNHWFQLPVANTKHQKPA